MNCTNKWKQTFNISCMWLTILVTQNHLFIYCLQWWSSMMVSCDQCVGDVQFWINVLPVLFSLWSQEIVIIITNHVPYHITSWVQFPLLIGKIFLFCFIIQWHSKEFHWFFGILDNCLLYSKKYNDRVD